MHTHEMSLADRVRGCLTGGALGDALGHLVEDARWNHIRQDDREQRLNSPENVSGQLLVTNVTQMTLYTVDGLLEALEWANDGVQSDETAGLWLAYLRWLATQSEQPPSSAPSQPARWIDFHDVLHHRRSPDNVCISGLMSGDMGTIARPVNVESTGNGSLMRSAPIGLIPHMPQKALSRLAINASALTHGHPGAHHSAAVFALVINDVVHGGHDIPAALERAVERAAEGPVPELEQRLRAAVELPADSGSPDPTSLTGALGGGWVAEEALAISFHAALAAERLGGSPTDKFRMALRIAVNHDGDSGSTASMAGSIMGAAYGTAALPDDGAPLLDVAAVLSEAAERFIKLTGLR
ncbi:ADP-ribosylglycohydrolase family protein [Arthrobacter roseus]|uniref:ADP-ribosylglycohydrolase family protein n=1 Tax=Arthrobacter roseus TaxID=136274 RepID=UPI001EF8265B|nr:ADP-ribosylglycohydrolase family protein [Arthrobacter roseus]MBM7848987.1 ADP-ribosylglycohydrolase [Arthrobacter roseus]